MPRVAALDCDVQKDFPPSVGFRYYGDRVQAWLSEPGDDGWSWRQFRVNSERELPSLDEVASSFDGFVIPGSRSNVTDPEPWIPPLIEVIRRAHELGKALVGICFGHQIIAHALGGTVSPRPPFNFTLDTIQLLPAAGEPAAAHLGLNSASTLQLYKAHGFQVTEPPPGALVLAESERTPVEMYSLQANVFCCQSHPEFTKATMLAIVENLKALEEDSPSHMSAARAEEAVRRLDAAEASPEPLRALARSLLARAPSTTTHL